MAFERRDYEGGAVDTTIAADSLIAATTFTLTSSTGWPSGGASGPFDFIVDYDVAGKEKCRAASRTGNTLNSVTRGIDGTVASDHFTGAKIRHCHTSIDSDEANKTMAETIGRITTKGDLTPGTGANATTRLGAGANNTVLIADSTQASGLRWATLTSASLGTDSVGSTQIAADAVGASEIAADSVGTSEIAPLAVTAAEIANDTITATQIAANAIGASELADNAVDTNAIANLAVTVGKIADGTIVNGAKLGTGQKLYYSQAADPGAVGADLLWWNTTTRALLVRNAGNTAWEVIGGTGAWQSYTPSLFNITLGNGVRFGRYIRMGRIIVGNIWFFVGGTTVFAANIGFGLPFNAADLDSFVGYPGVASNEFYSHGASRGLVGGSAIYAGVGVTPQAGASKALDRVIFFATAGTAAWGAGVPAAWGAGDRVSIFFEYEVANAEDANYD